MFLLAGIIITITHKDGTKTEINVPDEAGVEVRQDGKIVAKIPAKPSDPPTPNTPPGTPALSASPPPRVSASAPLAPSDAPPPDYPAERKAAVWVVQHGSVQVADELGQIWPRPVANSRSCRINPSSSWSSCCPAPTSTTPAWRIWPIANRFAKPFSTAIRR